MAAHGYGKRNVIIEIMREQETPDATGGVIATWLPVRRLWAEMDTRKGKETFDHERVENVATTYFVFRNYNDLRDADRVRVTSTGEVYNLVTIHRSGPRAATMRVATERGAV